MHLNGPTAARRASALTVFPLPQIAFAMRIFFPPREDKSARQEAKKRLRMILVADRCTLPVSSLTTMKTEIVKAVSQFVEVEGEETVDVNLTRDESLGTVRAPRTPARVRMAQCIMLPRGGACGSVVRVKASGAALGTLSRRRTGACAQQSFSSRLRIEKRITDACV